MFFTPRTLKVFATAFVFVAVAVAMPLAMQSSESVEGYFFGVIRPRWMVLSAVLVYVAFLTITYSSRRTFIPAVATTLGLMLAGLLLELVAIVGIANWPVILGIHQERLLGGEPIPSYELVGRTYMDLALAANIRHEPVPFEFKTNSFGFRGEHDHAEVLVLGDSIVVYPLVPYEDSITGRLESTLGVPVMNFALMGISPVKAKRLLLEADPEVDLKGKLVLQLLFEGNDLEDYEHEQEGLSTAPPTLSWSQRLFVPAVVQTLARLSSPPPQRSLSRSCEAFGQNQLFLWSRPHFAPYLHNVEPIHSHLRALHQTVRERGGTYVLVYVPSKLRVLAPFCTWPAGSDLADVDAHLSPWMQSAQAFAQSAEIPLINVFPALRRVADGGESPWFWGDTHPNGIGHRAMATAIVGSEAVKHWMQTERASRAERPDPEGP